MAKKVQVITKSKFDFGPYWAWFFPVSALFIKFITMANIPGHIWPGSDAESYLDAVNGLVSSGIFSNAEKLQYFPAGYPIIIWVLAKVSIPNALLLLSIFQSLIYSYASWYFIKNINFGRFQKLAPWVAFLISFNPTLSLSSLAIGYESLVAAALMISAAALLSIDSTNLQWRKFLVFGSWSAFASFLQPRYLATSSVILIYWMIKEIGLIKARKFFAVAMLLILLAPISLGFRNSEATGKFFVSNNLGVTMNVGAGPNSTGGYTNKATGVSCPENVVTDNQKVVCVVKWYLTNPLQTIRLSYNKTLYFFSPWSGPLANGTMARNPWQKINPVAQTAKSQDGFNMIYGGFGKAVSWLWFISSFGLMIWGAIWLWRQGEELRKLSSMASLFVLISWIIALGTIGDHRFRMPVMAFIFILQMAGLRGLSRKPLVLKPSSLKR